MNYSSEDNDQQQAPLPPKPPVIPGLIILVLTIAGIALILIIASIHTETPAPSPVPIATPTAPLYTDHDIEVFANNVLGHTLNPTDSITVSGGVVTISRAEPLSLSTEQTPPVGELYYKYAVTAGIAQVYYDEKAIWKMDNPSIVSVIAIVSALDSNNHPTPYVRVLVTANTAQSIQWDSLYSEDAWKLYDSTWQYGDTSGSSRN
jgi:hypothetical protein